MNTTSSVPEVTPGKIVSEQTYQQPKTDYKAIRDARIARVAPYSWKPGQSGNPSGLHGIRPEIAYLREAIAETEKEKKKSLWKHLVEQCYVDNAVLIAVARKFLPDLSVNVEMGNQLILRLEKLTDSVEPIDANGSGAGAGLSPSVVSDGSGSDGSNVLRIVNADLTQDSKNG